MLILDTGSVDIGTSRILGRYGGTGFDDSINIAPSSSINSSSGSAAIK